MSKAILITGASSGFGLSMAMQALKRGKKVIAATRDPAKAAAANPDLEKLGGIWMALDVNQAAARDAVSQAVSQHDIDVVVNNAASALIGAFEDMSEDEYAASMNTNVMGPFRVTQGALPHFRAARAGTIVNIGSMAGVIAGPSRACYAATKHALEGMSEALAAELAPFGVRVLLVEPGAFRTPFADRVTVPALGTPARGGNGNVSAAYAGSPAEQRIEQTRRISAEGAGDPDKAAAAILDAVDLTGCMAGKKYLRLPLGKDAATYFAVKLKALQENVDAVAGVTGAMDFDGK